MNPTHPTQTGGATIRGGSDDTSGPGPELMTADTLEGDEVLNRNGESLGKIDEIMIDVRRGRVAYAVMKSGGFLGMGGKLFAIPWAALTLDADRHCFVLDADKSTFENAPGFDKDRWPDTATDLRWHSDVHQRFNAREYWN